LNSNVLCISNHSFMLGGGEQSFLDLISHLPVNWQTLTVLPQKGELAFRLEQEGVETSIIPLPPVRPWFISQMITALSSYYSLCRKLCPALIYANGSRAALYGGIVGRMLGVPIIWHCRIVQRDPWLDPLLARLSTQIVANSQATSKRFTTRFRPKIRVIYNGVNIEWLQNSSVRKPDLIQNEWKVILSVARVSKSKRHDLVLSAFETVAEFDPRVHLVCLGAKDELQTEWWNYLQKKIRQSPFSARIHWVGWVDDIRAWFRVADLLVLSSDNEAFGRVIIEALACEVPVIATRVGGVPEIVRDGLDGILITPGNHQELADAALLILRDITLREALIQSGIKRANLFSLDTHVMKMTQLFEETINPLSSA
jgi:glycosyltransferase involved in cell wall biosynthesis